MNLYKSLQSDKNFFLIAGTCVIEDKEIMYRTAEFLKKETEKRGINFIFKSSFLKANRSSVESFTGPGIEKGLRILEDIKKKFEVNLCTDIHEISDAKKAAEIIDIIQIPAFLARQTKLITAAAKTDKIVNIKKAQFMAPEDMKLAANKALSEKNNKILLTERGTSFGYHNLVVDFRSFPIMKNFGFPIVYDVTHSLQRPSISKTSGGNPEFVPMMAKAAIATGFVNGLFIEAHPNPKKGLSDAASMLNLNNLPKLLDECLQIKGL